MIHDQEIMPLDRCQEAERRTSSSNLRRPWKTVNSGHIPSYCLTMVLLCMTPLAVQAIEEARKVAEDELLELQLPEPVAGEPISHSQLIDLSKLLRKHADDISVHGVDGDPPSYTLDSLLKGSRFYVPPPPPKKEPVRPSSTLVRSTC